MTEKMNRLSGGLSWAFLLCGGLLGFFLNSCQSDGKEGRTGTFGLRLEADTTASNRGVDSQLRASEAGYEEEFERFLETSDYSVYIVKDQKDTVQSYARYDQMPAEIELTEGAYTLIAAKGSNAGAAFDNPYFEGYKDFSIRGDMNTFVDVTCTLGNTRVTVESAQDFDEMYDDYTVYVTTPYTDKEGFEIDKGETDPAYFRADREGTDASVVLEMTKKGETSSTKYTVPNKLRLERRQNVRMLLKMSESGASIGIEILINDDLTNSSVTIDIPSSMWKPAESTPTLVLSPESNDITMTAGGLDEAVDINFSIPMGISSFIIKQEVGGNQKQYDLANNWEAALEAGLTWKSDEVQGDNPSLKKENGKAIVKNGIVHLKEFLNNLAPNNEGESYRFSIYAQDASDAGTETNALKLTVTVNAQ